MGTIRTAIALSDGASGPLKAITMATRTAIEGFDGVKNALSEAVDTRAIDQGADSLQRMQVSSRRVEIGLHDAGDEQVRLNREFRNGQSAAGSLEATVKKVFGAIAAAAGVKQALALSDELVSVKTRLAMIAREGENVLDIQGKIFASAQAARGGYLDTAQAVAKLGLTAEKAFNGTSEIIRFMELANKSFVVAGASATEASSAIYQLTQAMGSGRLQGDEYRSIIENAPLLAKSIEDYMRNVVKAKGTMKEWAADGLLTADVIKAAMFQAAGEIEERFASMPMTFAQIWTWISNMAVQAFDPVLMRLNEIGNSEAFRNFVNLAVQALQYLAMVATQALTWIVNLVNWAAENWSWLEPVIKSVAAAWLSYKIVVGAVTVAQALLNAVMSMNPLMLVLMLVIGLAMAFLFFTDTMMGALYVAGAFFMNVEAWAWSVLDALWAAFENCGLAIMNFFCAVGGYIGALLGNLGAWGSNVSISMQNSFLSMAETVISSIRSIIEWLNRIPFVNIDTSGLSNKISDYARQRAENEARRVEYANPMEAWQQGLGTFDAGWGRVTEAYNKRGAFNAGWAQEAYQAGAARGTEIGASLRGLLGLNFGQATSAIGAAENLWDGVAFDTSALVQDAGAGEGANLGKEDAYEQKKGANAGKTAKNTGETAKNTAKTADALDALDNDLAYLVDIASREAVNRFMGVNLRLDMNNHNQINERSDLAGVVTYVAGKLRETLDTAVEGVHF